MAPNEVISLPFSKGVDTKVDSYQLPPGQFDTLENVAFNKLGAMSKRTGHDEVAPDNSLAQGTGIGHWRGQTLVCDGKHLYQVQSGGALKDLGGTPLPLSIGFRSALSRPQILSHSCSVDTVYQCVAVETRQGVEVQVVNRVDGSQVTSYFFPGLRSPKLVYFQALARHIVVCIDGAAGGVRGYVLDPAADQGAPPRGQREFWIEYTVHDDFDVWAESGEGETPCIYIAFGSTIEEFSGLYVKRFSAADDGGLLSRGAVGAPSATIPTHLYSVTGCLLPDGSSAVAWLEGHPEVEQLGIHLALFKDGVCIQTQTPIAPEQFYPPGAVNPYITGVTHIALVWDGARLRVVFDCQADSRRSVRQLVLRDDYKAVESYTFLAWKLVLAGEPAVISGRVVVPCVTQVDGQRQYILLDVTTGETPAVLATLGMGAGAPPVVGMLPAIGTAGGKYYLSHLMAGDGGLSVSVSSWDHTPSTFYGVEIAQAFYFLLGTRVYRYDGAQVAEDGFDAYPDRARLPSATGSAHKYNYQVVWSWTDALGLRHFSAPSPLCTIRTANPIGTGDGHESLTIYAPIYVLPTLKDANNIRVHLYRSEDNGDVMREVGSKTKLEKDPLADTVVTFVDNVSDAQLVGSDAFGSALPTPQPCTLTAQPRGICPPALCAATRMAGGGLPIGAGYYYYVLTALTPYGETPPSDVAGNMYRALYSGAQSLLVNWSQHSKASGYRLYRGTSESGPFSLLKELGAGETSFLDDGSIGIQAITPPTVNTTASGRFLGPDFLGKPLMLACGRLGGGGSLSGQPRYRITAANALGETMASIERGGPADFGDVPLDGDRVVLGWSQVVGATAYKIYRGDDVGREGYIAQVNAPNLTYTDDGSITPGNPPPTEDTSADGYTTVTTVAYRVAAKNETGTTLASTEVTLALKGVHLPCGVLVNWPRLPGAFSYQVFGRTAGAEELLVETGELSWLDKNDKTPAGDLPASNTTGPRPYTGGELLYTSGGVIPNMPPGPTCFLTEHQKRLVGIDASNKLRLWFSQQAVYGYPLEGNPLLQYIDLPSEGGDCFGVASLDDKLIIFKRNTVLWLTGAGPDATGNGEFSMPIPLSSDVGLLDPKSLVAATEGVLFRSVKGLYRINRALVADYFGAPAEDLWAAGDVTRSSILNALDNEVRWYLPGNNGTETARAIVYHYLFGQWSLHKMSTFGVVQAAINPISGLMEGVGPFGQVVRSNRSLKTDLGSQYTRKVRTGWIRFSQINGYGRLHRVMLLAHWLSAHQLQVSLEFDESTANPQVALIVAPDALEPERWQINPRTHRVESLRVTLEDDGEGGNLDMSVLSFLVSLAPGFKRLGTAGKHSAVPES